MVALGLGAFLAGWFAYATALSADFAQEKAYPDFISYYSGAVIVARGQGAQLYSLDYQGQVQAEVVGVRLLPFVNPPFVALFFVPFTWLPLWTAYAAWSTLGWVLFGGALALMMGSAGDANWRERVVFLALSVSFAPWLAAQMQAQTTAVVLLAATLVWLALAKGRDGAAGLFSALMLFKPQFFVLFPVLYLLQRRWRALAGAALGAGLLLAISLALVGVQGMVDYARLLLVYPSAGDELGVHVEAMPTWRGFSLALLGSGPAGQAVGWSLSLMTVLFVLWTWRNAGWKGHTVGASLATLLVTQLLISPHLNSHDLALLLPSGYLAWRFLRHRSVTLLTSDVWGLFLVGSALFIALSQLTLFNGLDIYQTNLLLTPVMALLLFLFGLELKRAPLT